jgi:hypothetical protein
MVNNIKLVISKCERCQLNRPQQYSEHTENILIDIIVAEYYYTKWMEAEPTKKSHQRMTYNL